MSNPDVAEGDNPIHATSHEVFSASPIGFARSINTSDTVGKLLNSPLLVCARIRTQRRVQAEPCKKGEEAVAPTRMSAFQRLYHAA